MHPAIHRDTTVQMNRLVTSPEVIASLRCTPFMAQAVRVLSSSALQEAAVAEAVSDNKVFNIYRWNPADKTKPRYQTYTVDMAK